jgi:hypothetical protein
MPVHLRVIQWLFAPPQKPLTTLRIIGWWELRRIPFNLIIGTFGLLALCIFVKCISDAHVLRPGDDAFEPVGLILAPFGINICYTAGWLVDAPLRLFRRTLAPAFTPFLLKLGFGLSFFLISLPAIYWAAYRVLQIFHLIDRS